MTDDYREVLDKFKAGTLQLDKPVYDYSGDKLEAVYDRFYHSMNGHLQQRAKLQGWPPPVLLFVDSPAVNAFAAPKKVPRMIGINRGLIETMYDLFESQKPILDEAEYDGIRAVLSNTGEEPFVALLEYVLLFCYQHEYTHLLQLSPAAPFEFSEIENLPPNPADVPVLHAFEMDADHIATHRIAWSIAEHFQDDGGNWLKVSSDEITNLASAALAGIFCLFVHYAQKYPLIYYGENKHPHPLIRIAFVAQYLPKVIAGSLPQGVTLDDKKALTQALDLAEKILQPKYGDAVRGLADTLIAHKDEIEAYGNRIIDKALNMEGLSHRRPVEHL